MVVKGNERVLRARLSDARFFFDEDQKVPLDERVEALKSVVYQQKLGTSFEKMERFRALAEGLADRLNPAVTRQGLTRRHPLQGRPGHRHGGRVPGGAGDHGARICAS